jgi:hypothetical protein
VVVLGLTMIDAPVWLSDHFTVPVQFTAVNVVLSPAQISGFKQVITGGAGGVFTLIDNSFDLSDLQVADSQVAVYLISAVGVIVLGEPVTPSDHVTVPLHPLEVKVIDVPAQTVNLSAVMVGLAKSVTVISFLFDTGLTQVPIVQVAVYEVETVGVTVILFPVNPPGDHVTVPLQPVAVNSTDEPEQIVEVPELTTGGAGFSTFTVTGVDFSDTQYTELQVAV